MSTGRWLGVGVFLLLAAAVLLGVWLRSDEEPQAMAMSSAVPPSASASGMPPAQALPPDVPVVPTMPGEDSPLPPAPGMTMDAGQSMGIARELGDPRAPAVQRDAAREMPTAQELADPAAYQRYEARQSERLHKAYVRAADEEVPRLQKDIERARREGLTPEQIAEGEEKLRRIQAMRDQLQTQDTTSP